MRTVILALLFARLMRPRKELRGGCNVNLPLVFDFVFVFYFKSYFNHSVNPFGMGLSSVEIRSSRLLSSV